MSDYLTRSTLSVHPLLVDFVEREALPGLSVTPDQFWTGFAGLVTAHAPINARLLQKRVSGPQMARIGNALAPIVN